MDTITMHALRSNFVGEAIQECCWITLTSTLTITKITKNLSKLKFNVKQETLRHYTHDRQRLINDKKKKKNAQ